MDFAARFGAPPTHLSRAPGRVNLIGEHTDYNDLPVLPMALQREVRILLRPRTDGRVRLHNVSAEFEPVEYDAASTLTPGPPGHWGNYAMAPAAGLSGALRPVRGFDGLVSSDVPVASGLSSSSALVNAVGLALARLAGLDADPLPLAELMAEAERFTGTRGGGMDQAISLAAREGTAALIEFAPLRLTHVPVPPDWRFVVADTGVRAEKSGAAQRAYNERRAECENALRIVSTEVVRGDASAGWADSYPALLDRTGFQGALLAGDAALSGVLAARFRHVVTEARRVRDACDALASGDAARFGALMDASHESLREDYEVSSAELDALVAAAKAGGALGARLTGAGFGGCVVALARAAEASGVMRSIRRRYLDGRPSPARMEDRVFTARPSRGASFQPL
ncbi:MAG TPA: galactokinase [Longimicrobiales bacterium]|nr:galactokinase [Longimicrobiales bacterium]